MPHGVVLLRNTGVSARNDVGAGGSELDNRRLEVRLGYGFSAFGDRFTQTPELGLGLSNGSREYSLGWRLRREMRGAIGALELSLEATCGESANDNAGPRHGVRFGLTARW